MLGLPDRLSFFVESGMGRVERTDTKELSMGKIFVVFKKDRTLSRMAIKPISELTMERISHSLSD